MRLHSCRRTINVKLAALYQRREAVDELIGFLENYACIASFAKALPGAGRAARRGRRPRVQARMVEVNR
jgi:hypothetical protein